MASPKRQRPTGPSVILTPLVEQLNMPVNADPEPEANALESPAPAAGPQATVPEEEALVEERVEGLAENTTSATEHPDQVVPEPSPAGPSETLPSEDSREGVVETETASQDAKPQPEAQAVNRAAEPASAPEAAHAVAVAPEAPPAPAAVPVPEVYIPPNMKQPVTINMRTVLKLRAETAVLRTGHLSGGYRSQVQLIEAAVEKELARLEAEFNNGEPFPPNVGSFRTGRPLGS